MTARLRILALNWRCIQHPQAGGCEVNLFEQARRWARSGHEVTVFCADPGREQGAARDEVVDGVRVVRRGGRFGVYAWGAWHVLTSASRYDRVLEVSNGVPFFAPLFTDLPTALLVHHVHGDQWFRELPAPAALVGRFLERFAVPWLYRDRPVIAVSESTRDALIRDGFPDTAIQVIHNGVSVPVVDGPRVRPAGQRIVSVGRLKRYKRLPLLVEAVDRLRQELPAVHLDIVGDGDARAEIVDLVARLDLRRHVTVHGFVSEQDKLDLLTAATVFAAPSMHEGWGLAVLEANALGRPAIAFDVPGLRHAIRHQETGLLARDDRAFEDGLRRLLTDAVLWERLSDGARRWAASFDWGATARETLAVLDSGVRPEPIPEAAPVVALR